MSHELPIQEIPVDESMAAAVERLSQLSPMEYDRVREAEAKRLGCRVGTLDKEVRKASPDNEESAGAALAMDDPEPWPDPVDGEALAGDIVEAVRRHMVLDAPAVDAVALWVLHAHAHGQSRVSPILSITSPQKRCGKTTLLTLLQAMVPRPLPASNITAAALFRAVEQWRPTLLVDEADTFLRESDELRGVINSGHNRAGAYVVRVVGDTHEPRMFSTWAPKSIALIGNMPGTLADRSVGIALRRKKPGETAQPIRLDRLDGLAAIPRKAQRWVHDNARALEQADPEIPSGLHDRAADNWRSLFAIADIIGGQWPDRSRSASVALLGDSDQEDAAGVLLLQDVRRLFGDHDRVTSAQLVEDLARLDSRPWPEWRGGKPITARQIARLLQPFGIRSRQFRLSPTVTGVHGYRLADFDDAFSRYLPARTATTLQPSNGAAFGDSRSATPPEPVADGKHREPASDKACSAVADEKPLHGEEREL